MPQQSFGSNQQVIPVLDAGPDGAWIVLQVLDGSTFFFDTTRDALQTSGGGAGANATQGFQIKAANGLVSLRWTGVLWGRSDTNQGLINAAITYRYKKSSCGGKCGGNSAPAPQVDEG